MKPILTSTVRRFLAKRSVARLATLSADGYPHVVPIWFALDGEDIVFASDDGERKVRNARANPHATALIGGDPEIDEAGYMIQGDIRVEANVGGKITRKIARRYQADVEPEWVTGGTVILRLTPRRVIRVM